MATADDAAACDMVAPYSRGFGRASIAAVLGAPDGGLGLVGRALCVGGWVRTGRGALGGAIAAAAAGVRPQRHGEWGEYFLVRQCPGAAKQSGSSSGRRGSFKCNSC